MQNLGFAHFRGRLLEQLQKLRRDERQQGEQLLLEALGGAALQRGEFFAGRDLKLGLLKGGGFRRVVSPRGNGGVKADGDGQAADIDGLVR